MKLRYSLLILAASVQAAGAEVNITGRYALPASKVYLEPCRHGALLLHPGMLDKQRIRYLHGDFLGSYEIEMRDGSGWLVLCDLANGNIIGEQKLVGGAY
ncbi:MAG: hypothetical protein Q7U57_07520 [Methylovulum sp.]|nr:hypothetical protein [Methylovulum sp.]